MTPRRSLPRASLAALALFALAACARVPHVAGPPPYAPRNFAGEARLPATLRRVVLLPAAGAAPVTPEQLRELDVILHRALELQDRFEVVRFDREDCRRRYGVDALGSASALPPGLLGDLAADFAADAVLFVDVTLDRPYRPLALGLRAKLADAKDSHLLWTFDEVVSAEDPRVAAAVRAHYAVSGAPADLTRTALQSPSQFAGFVAEAMFGTLPPR